MIVDPLGSVEIEPGAAAKGASLFVSAEKNTKNKGSGSGSARDVAGAAGVSKEDIEKIVDAAAADGSMDARQARDARAKQG